MLIVRFVLLYTLASRSQNAECSIDIEVNCYHQLPLTDY
jgi:hypothetical protein